MVKEYKYIINPKSTPQPALTVPRVTPLPPKIADYAAGDTVQAGTSVVYNGVIYRAKETTNATPIIDGGKYEVIGFIDVDGLRLEIRPTKRSISITGSDEVISYIAEVTYNGLDLSKSFFEHVKWESDAGEMSVRKSGCLGILTPRKDLPAGVYEVKAIIAGYGVTDKVAISKNSAAQIEAERKAREAAIEKERRAREAKEREFTQAIEQAKQSGAQDVSTLTDLLNKANQKLGALEKQVDKEVSNWFYAGAPSANKLPESEWTTNAIKANHINDTYTSIDKSGRYQGKSWRYTTEFKWQEIHDTQISQALSMAAKAQTTADGKSTTYLSKPTKYEEGDTWVLESTQTVNGTRYEKGTYLFATQSSSVFVQAHWVDKLKYISKSETESKIRASESASKLAWEAYAKAQAEAERVKAEAHADGIVTAEEQARIEAVNKALQAAKKHAEAQDKLLEERQKAYADGVLTEAERRAIEVAEKEAKLAETNANAYADGVLTEAEKKAIAEAQKAYDDAVAKAKELDGQIQVGGRNLMVKSRWVKGYILQGGKPFRFKNFHYDPTYIDVGNNTSIVWTLYSEAIDESESQHDIILNFYDANKEFVAWRFGKGYVWKQDIGVPSYFKFPDDVKYVVIGVTSSNVVGKVEFGTVATDWTPAPEDVQAEIDAVERGYQKLIERVDVEFAISNSRDTAPTSGWQTNAPTPARGQALWQRTKVYLKDGTEEVRGTTCIQGKNGQDGADGRGIAKIVELYYLSSSNTALANGAWTETAPTPKEGFWIWTKTRIHYTTGEQIETQPICVTGNKGADAVVSKVVTIDTSGLDENMYYPIAITDTPTSVQNRYRVYTKLYYSSNPSWATHEKGFQCELIWRCYNSSWGGFDVNMQVEVASYKFVNNVPPISQPSQIVEYSVNYTYVRGGGKYYVELQAREQATLDDITVELVTAKKSYGRDPYIRYLEPQTSITAPITDLDKEAKAREKVVQEINAGLSNANTLIATLEKTAKELKQGLLSKADVEGIQYLLDSLQKGSTDFAGGILLTNDIILSEPNSGKVTATLSGSAVQGHKALRLGIQDSSKEMTAFSNDGTGHVGPLYFRGGMLEFVDESVDTQVLAIGKGTMSKRLNDIINSNSVNSYLINNASGSLNYHNDVESWTLNVSNDNTKIVVKGKLRARGQAAQSAGGNMSFSGCGITLSIDGVGTIGTAGSMCTHMEGLPPNCTLGTATINSVFYLNRGRYTVTVQQKGNGETSYEDLRLQQIWSSNKSFNAISEKGVRFYGNKDKYFDLNYSLPSNIDTLEIRGGLNVDYINTSGAVLAGAKFNRDGGKDKQFGRYCARHGSSSASASYNDRTDVFTVYHSIPHSNYVPMITISEAGSARTSTVIGIFPYSFQIQIFSGFNKTQAAFSYVAFQAD